MFKAYRKNKSPHTNENLFFSALASALKMRYQNDTTANVILIGNISIAGAQIDAILIKDDAIILLEFKNYSGDITIDDITGVWFNNDTEIRGGNPPKTPLQQIKISREVVIDYISNSDFTLNDSPLIFATRKVRHISGIIGFSGDIQFNIDQLHATQRTWLNVVGGVNDMVQVIDNVSTGLKFNADEMFAIASNLNVIGCAYPPIVENSLKDPEDTVTNTVTNEPKIISPTKEPFVKKIVCSLKNILQTSLITAVVIYGAVVVASAPSSKLDRNNKEVMLNQPSVITPKKQTDQPKVPTINTAPINKHELKLVARKYSILKRTLKDFLIYQNQNNAWKFEKSFVNMSRQDKLLASPSQLLVLKDAIKFFLIVNDMNRLPALGEIMTYNYYLKGNSLLLNTNVDTDRYPMTKHTISAMVTFTHIYDNLQTSTQSWLKSSGHAYYDAFLLTNRTLARKGINVKEMMSSSNREISYSPPMDMASARKWRY